jgi:hypothetical protein
MSGECARSFGGGLNVSASISRLTSRAAAAFSADSSVGSSTAGTGTRRARCSFGGEGVGAGFVVVGVRAGEKSVQVQQNGHKKVDRTIIKYFLTSNSLNLGLRTAPIFTLPSSHFHFFVDIAH